MLTNNVNLQNKTVLLTGAAGFIGANLTEELLKTVPGIRIVGLDNMNSYYDVSIKEYLLEQIEKLAKEQGRRTGEKRAQFKNVEKALPMHIKISKEG